MATWNVTVSAVGDVSSTTDDVPSRPSSVASESSAWFDGEGLLRTRGSGHAPRASFVTRPDAFDPTDDPGEVSASLQRRSRRVEQTASAQRFHRRRLLAAVFFRWHLRHQATRNFRIAYFRAAERAAAVATSSPVAAETAGAGFRCPRCAREHREASANPSRSTSPSCPACRAAIAAARRSRSQSPLENVARSTSPSASRSPPAVEATHRPRAGAGRGGGVVSFVSPDSTAAAEAVPSRSREHRSRPRPSSDGRTQERQRTHRSHREQRRSPHAARRHGHGEPSGSGPGLQASSIHVTRAGLSPTMEFTDSSAFFHRSTGPPPAADTRPMDLNEAELAAWATAAIGGSTSHDVSHGSRPQREPRSTSRHHRRDMSYHSRSMVTVDSNVTRSRGPALDPSAKERERKWAHGVTARYHAMRHYRRHNDAEAYCAELLELGQECLQLAGEVAVHSTSVTSGAERRRRSPPLEL